MSTAEAFPRAGSVTFVVTSNAPAGRSCRTMFGAVFVPW